MTPRARLVVGAGADVMRRSLGPTSWAALEVLASASTEIGGHAIATASVRDVAEALGVARNTAHRAVRRLVEVGLAAPLQERSNDGRFVTGSYRLVITVDVLQIDGPPTRPTTTRPHPPERRAHRPSADCQQLSLLPSHD